MARPAPVGEGRGLAPRRPLAGLAAAVPSLGLGLVLVSGHAAQAQVAAQLAAQLAQVQAADPVDGVVVTPPAKARPAPSACAPADYACLGAALKAAAGSARPADPIALGEAVQADVPSRVGTFSQTATAQRLGQNFGHAATPWRPTTAANTNAILAAHSTQGRPTR